MELSDDVREHVVALGSRGADAAVGSPSGDELPGEHG